MSYKDLLKISNIIDHKVRLITFAKHYKSIKLDGLYYVNFITSSNTLSISHPDHRTHHEATAYLLFKKSYNSINTAKNQAHHLKKFLDYLLIWDLDILQDDLLVILLGFIDYLRNIEANNSSYTKSIRWATVTEVPLHQQAYTYGQISKIAFSKDGFMDQKTWNELSYESILQAVSASIQFINFLKERTTYYKDLCITSLPVKARYKESMLSGTLGKNLITIIDIKSMLDSVGLKPIKDKKSLILEQKVFTVNQADTFINFIPQQHHQNRLLFHILKFFGLRAAEAANLMIDTSSLPTNLLFMEHFKAREFIKNNLKGDIEYSNHINKWVCYVVERDNQDYRSQHKSGSREVPFLFSEELFLDLLLNALKEREVLIRYTKKKHSFLFVSRQNQNKGNPITGQTIRKRYTHYADKLHKEYNIDLKNFSPHSFRHFFATYLIRVRKEDLSDVSRWLGHSSIEITRKVYSHYIPTNDRNINIVEDMAQEFDFKEI
ncbi:site-specific integrase [Clostridium sp. C8-1-8]|uniref:tyrosine-type recombinase/integrase n=1 Tax=Clostridium sp. C8-1-8 TaxID=2698831 RepID=UPI0013682F55|nr:site-specific integrase [Clostridium sp. C8-1-8]